MAKQQRKQPELTNPPEGLTEGSEILTAGLEGATASLGLSDEQLSEEAHGDNEPPLAAPPAVRGAQGDVTRPYCPKHNVLLRAYASKETQTHYRCPVDGCETREKRVRPTLKVPAEPQMCPQRCCRDEDGPKVALEVDQRLSTLAQLHMACPKCGFNLKVPRPQFDAVLSRQRQQAAEDLAAR